MDVAQLPAGIRRRFFPDRKTRLEKILDNVWSLLKIIHDAILHVAGNFLFHHCTPGLLAFCQNRVRLVCMSYIKFIHGRMVAILPIVEAALIPFGTK